jgi:hypothetical protein
MSVFASRLLATSSDEKNKMTSRCKLCNEVVEPDDLLDALDSYSCSRHLRLVHHWDYIDNKNVSEYFQDE